MWGQAPEVLPHSGVVRPALELSLVFPLFFFFFFGERGVVEEAGLQCPDVSALEGENRLLAELPCFLSRVTQVFSMLAHNQIMRQFVLIG